MARPKRLETARQTTIYLTNQQRQAADNIKAKLPIVRDVELDSRNDAIGYSLIEVSRTLDHELHVRAASTRPRMG